MNVESGGLPSQRADLMEFRHSLHARLRRTGAPVGVRKVSVGLRAHTILASQHKCIPFLLTAASSSRRGLLLAGARRQCRRDNKSKECVWSLGVAWDRIQMQGNENKHLRALAIQADRRRSKAMETTAHISPSPSPAPAHNLSLPPRYRQPNPKPRSTFYPPRR